MIRDAESESVYVLVRFTVPEPGEPSPGHFFSIDAVSADFEYVRSVSREMQLKPTEFRHEIHNTNLYY